MRRFLVTLLTVLALPATASAATPWAGLQPVSGSRPAGLFVGMFAFRANDLAVNAAGDAAAAWVATDNKVYVARRPASGGWSEPVAITPDGTSASVGVSVAIDAAGDVTVLWASSTIYYTSTALAGAGFGTPQGVAASLGTITVPSLDIAMNASGQGVLAFSLNNTSGAAVAAVAATPGGMWTDFKAITGTDAGNTPRVAINTAGDAVATASRFSSGTYAAVGVFRNAGGTFSDPAVALEDIDQNSAPVPVIDSTRRVSVLVRNKPAAAVNPQGVIVVQRAANNQNFTATGAGDTAATGCTSGVTDYGGTLSVDAAGTVSAAYTCASTISVRTRPAGGSFGSPSVIGSTTTAPRLMMGTAPDGHTVLAVDDGTTDRAYRRPTSTSSFGTAEAFSDPEQAVRLEGLGVNDHGDAVALVGRPVGTPADATYDEFSSVLDTQPGTASIDGPATAAPGDLVTFSFVGADPFGGFTAAPAWTSSDGGSATNESFTRTFTTAGTYKIDVTRKDVGGFTASATKTLVVASPTATPTPGPSATATPTVSPSPTAGPTPTPTPAATKCVVPKLKGKTLAAARKALKQAHCKLGKVKKPKGNKKKLRVRAQTKKAKAKLKAGTKVGVTLKRKR